MRLTGDLHQKFFRKISKKVPIFRFFKGFRLRKICFCCFQLGKKWFSSPKRIRSGIFWCCKIEKIWKIVSFLKVVWNWTDSLTLGSPYDIASLVFSSKVPRFLRKCLWSTASPLCLKSHSGHGIWVIETVRSQTFLLSFSISADVLESQHPYADRLFSSMPRQVQRAFTRNGLSVKQLVEYLKKADIRHVTVTRLLPPEPYQPHPEEIPGNTHGWLLIAPKCYMLFIAPKNDY